MFTFNRRFIAAVLLSIASLTANAQSLAGHSECTMKPTMSSVANTDGYSLILSDTNCSYSGSGFDAASAFNQEIINFYQGNGPQSGYYTVTQGADSTIAKWTGNMSTIIKDGKPVTTGKGEWEYVGGTGKYQGIKGKGNWNAMMTSQTTYILDWKGNKN